MISLECRQIYSYNSNFQVGPDSTQVPQTT